MDKIEATSSTSTTLYATSVARKKIMNTTLDNIITAGQHVPALAIILVGVALASEAAYQLVNHHKTIITFLTTLRLWVLILLAYLLVAMTFAAALVGFWFGGF